LNGEGHKDEICYGVYDTPRNVDSGVGSVEMTCCCAKEADWAASSDGHGKSHNTIRDCEGIDGVNHISLPRCLDGEDLEEECTQ